MPPTAGPGVAVSGPVARQHETPREGIALDDGTWVDLGRNGKWHPSAGERARAAVVLGVSLGVLLVLALLLSVGGGDEEEDDVDVAADTSSTTDPEIEATAPTTATTAADVDPVSVGGDPAPEQCGADDRGGAPYRERDATAVLVLNATSRTGHGAAVVRRLEALGYATTVPDNAGRLRTSVFGYVDGYCAEAVRLAFELGLAEATFEPVDVARLPVPLGRARIVATVGADTV